MIAFPNKIYRHYKTKRLYQVLHIAKDSETLSDVVVYKCLYRNDTSKIWVRSLAMFEGKVDFEGQTIERFELVGEL